MGATAPKKRNPRGPAQVRPFFGRYCHGMTTTENTVAARLETLARILHRMEPTSIVRAILAEVRQALGHGRATVADVVDLETAVEALGIRGRSI